MTAIPKFTEGDKVKILDGSKIPDYAGGWDGIIMKEFIGKVVTVASPLMYFFNKGIKAYQLESNVAELERCAMYIWDERGLELVEPKPEPKFKPGDKVEIIASNEKIGTIKESWFTIGLWKYKLDEYLEIYTEGELRLVKLEPEPKFKPGDRVEILCGNFAGKIDTIKEVMSNKTFGRWYKLNEKNLIGCYKEEELRLVEPEPKFKVGDCVKILDGHGIFYVGSVYRINEVVIKNDKIAYILDGFKGWLFDECDLEIIPTKYKAGDKVKIINDFGISKKYVGKIFEVSNVLKIFEDGKVQYLLNGNGLKNYVINESTLELVKEDDIAMRCTNTSSSLIKDVDCEYDYIDSLLLSFGETRVVWFCLMNAVKNLWKYKRNMDKQALTKARRYFNMSVLSSNADNEETRQIKEIRGRIRKLLNECDG